jgi:hypothetical protein
MITPPPPAPDNSDLRTAARALWPWRIFDGRAREIVRLILKRLNDVR